MTIHEDWNKFYITFDIKYIYMKLYETPPTAKLLQTGQRSDKTSFFYVIHKLTQHNFIAGTC